MNPYLGTNPYGKKKGLPRNFVVNDLTITGLTEGSVLFAGPGGLVSEDNANLFWNDSTNNLFILGSLYLGTLTPATDRKLDVIGSNVQTSGFQPTIRLTSVYSGGTHSGQIASLYVQNQTAVGSNSPNTLYGIQAQVNNFGSGTITNALANVVTVHNFGSGTISEAYGLQIAGTTNTGGGSVVHFHGLHLADQTAFTGNVHGILSQISSGSTKYNLFLSGSAQNYIEGNVGIGSTPSTTTKLLLLAATTALSSLRVPHGVAPSSPVNGDMWTTTSGLFARINGSTKGPFIGTADIPILAHGTYTPSLTGVTNVAASAAYVCQYMRVGNTVTVSGKFDLDPTLGGGTATTLGVSLPIASNFTGTGDLGGCALGDATTQGLTTTGFAHIAANADITNDRANFNCLIYHSANATYWFTFTYVIK
jgi:hypothetical protein